MFQNHSFPEFHVNEVLQNVQSTNEKENCFLLRQSRYEIIKLIIEKKTLQLSV